MTKLNPTAQTLLFLIIFALLLIMVLTLALGNAFSGVTRASEHPYTNARSIEQRKLPSWVWISYPLTDNGKRLPLAASAEDSTHGSR